MTIVPIPEMHRVTSFPANHPANREKEGDERGGMCPSPRSWSIAPNLTGPHTSNDPSSSSCLLILGEFC